ncbi:MAG: 7-carboxy-7-deazaguanine synthase [Parvularculaceae bacterium]
MSVYSVKECYYTLQGEGAQTGRAAVFLRFAGCNLWTGLERDRPTAVCRFCDTDFVGVNGPGGGKFSSPEALAKHVRQTWPSECVASRFVVCTGGEPLLQLDAALIRALHEEGFSIGVETNGTIAVPEGVDWICVSPKANRELTQRVGHELKLVFPQLENSPADFEGLQFDHFFLQPLDGPEREANTKAAIAYCRAYPRWRLSLQTHKLLGIP